MAACLYTRSAGCMTGLIALSIAIACPGQGRAQAPRPPGPDSPGPPATAIPAPTVPRPSAPAASSPASPAAAKPDYTELVGELPTDPNAPLSAPAPPGYAPPGYAPPAYAMPKIVYGPLEVIRESMFGPAPKENWKPINLLTFFTEGWDEPFANAPEGTNLAPKQPWLGAPGGVFGRFWELNFFYTNHLNDVPGAFLTPNAPFMPVHMHTTGNQYAGYSDIWLPLNSRVEIVLGTVFIADNKSNPAGNYIGNWGDTGVQARFHLIEQRNFSFVGMIGERIPTGRSVNGNNIDYITPGAEFWWNFAPHWVLRGGTQQNIDVGRKTAASIYVNQLSIGRYLTGADAGFFKQLAVFCTVSELSGLSGQIRHNTDVYIFPAMRTGLGQADSWAAQFGVQIPVSGPQAYDWQPQFSLLKQW